MVAAKNLKCRCRIRVVELDRQSKNSRDNGRETVLYRPVKLNENERLMSRGWLLQLERTS